MGPSRLSLNRLPPPQAIMADFLEEASEPAQAGGGAEEEGAPGLSPAGQRRAGGTLRPRIPGKQGSSGQPVGPGVRGNAGGQGQAPLFLCQTSNSSCCPHPQACLPTAAPALPRFLEAPPPSCLSSGLDTRGALGSGWERPRPLEGAQVVLSLSLEAQSCGCSSGPAQASRTPSGQPNVDLERHLVTRAGSFSPGPNPPFPAGRPATGAQSPSGRRETLVALCLLLTVHVTHLDVISDSGPCRVCNAERRAWASCCTRRRPLLPASRVSPGSGCRSSPWPIPAESLNP